MPGGQELRIIGVKRIFAFCIEDGRFLVLALL